MRGYVQEIRPFGLIVALSRSINASISKNQLGNTPVNNVAEAFPVGKLIEARVKQIQKTERTQVKRVFIDVGLIMHGAPPQTAEPGCL